jgi:hypothetical protein
LSKRIHERKNKPKSPHKNGFKTKKIAAFFIFISTMMKRKEKKK